MDFPNVDANGFYPAPCPECGAIAMCEHYDIPESWPIEWLTPTEARVMRQNG